MYYMNFLEKDLSILHIPHSQITNGILHNLKAVYVSVFSGTAELRKRKKQIWNIVFNADIQCYTVSNRVEHIKDYLYKNLAKIYNHRKKTLGFMVTWNCGKEFITAQIHISIFLYISSSVFTERNWRWRHPGCWSACSQMKSWSRSRHQCWYHRRRRHHHRRSGLVQSCSYAFVG